MNTTTNKLTAYSSIESFSDEQIKSAMESIDFESPFFFIMGLINAMGSYITFHGGIEQQIKDEYQAMEYTLQFHLRLLKTALGYKCENHG